ncbi:hypothetical protein LIER_30118 [Lithospermum erythrorhizon]|uniref:Uncharacterized protein n=1 Tax=Lithospermum erythrorhizon TaxID=34254 RepID=A0AAV3RPT4_LITER
MEEAMVPKIRKRGCSSSSSTSSRLNNYRFKRAILVGKGKSGHGLRLGGSRSSTPVPSWKMRSSVESLSGCSRPVSARRLAATLWEMNEMPTPRMVERKKSKSGLSGSGSLPPHLSDPSHSPVSEKMDRSGTGSRQRRTSTTSQRLIPTDGNVLESMSSASLMETETRSLGQSVSGSVVGVKIRLKDVSNALTTSKELLRIINRIWASADRPSSSMSLVSALHTELERARLLVNQVILEKRSDQSEISYLMKRFAEEKASWKNKEQLAVATAIESIAGELEVERKLRRRSESLNKKLAQELAETKALFLKAVKELEGEKRAREVTEQVCDELARNISEDKYKMEEMKRESAKIQEEFGKEPEILHVVDKVPEHRVRMKLPEAKHKFEEKNSAIDKLRKQLESFLGRKKRKAKGRAPQSSGDQDMATHSSISSFGLHHDDVKKYDGGEVEDAVEDDASAESDLHSIELNMEKSNKIHNLAPGSIVGHDSRRASAMNEMKGTSSFTGQVPRRSEALLRSISDAVEWDTQPDAARNSLNILGQERLLSKQDKQAHRRSCLDETERNQSTKSRRDEMLLSNYKAGNIRDFTSPTRQWEHPWSLGVPVGLEDKTNIILGSHAKSRLAEIGSEGQGMRGSKR